MWKTKQIVFKFKINEGHSTQRHTNIRKICFLSKIKITIKLIFLLFCLTKKYCRRCKMKLHRAFAFSIYKCKKLYFILTVL